MGDWGEKITGKYKVKREDNLSSISKNLGIPIDSLISFNNIKDPNKINVDQELLWRKDPSFLDNVIGLFTNNRNNEINSKINRNINTPITTPINNEIFNTDNISNYLKNKHNIDLFIDTNNIRNLYSFFKDNGYNKDQNLAILSNIIAESGGDPFRRELGGGSGEGLLQFTDSARKNLMKSYINPKAKDEFYRQAHFINDEMRGNIKFSNGQVTQWLGDNRKSEKIFFDPNSTLYDKVSAYVKSYVRPGNIASDTLKRYKIAKALEEILVDKYKVGGKFTPKKSQLVKNSENQNSKRDMRKKFIKSSRPTYTNTKIKKGQNGLSSNWTSEDLDNPVYSKKRPLSIEEQKKIFIEDRQNQGLRNFDKGMKIAYAMARLAPGPIGTATNIIDLVKGDGETGDILATGNPLVEGIVDYRAKTSGLLNKPWGKDILKFSKVFQIYPIKAFDTIQDAAQLYNTIKSNNQIEKKQQGGIISYTKVDPSIFASWNQISTTPVELPEIETPSKLDMFVNRTINNEIFKSKDKKVIEEDIKVEEPKQEISKKEVSKVEPSKGTDAFNKAYDEVVKEMPEAAEYRDFLTTVAKHESNFNNQAKNKYAPAWGYFQFMQDDVKYNNIRSFAGIDTLTFLNDPKAQIKAAVKLAQSMEKGFSKEDLEAAKSKDISRWGMLGGAWLGGNGGLRRYLLQGVNISDKHWNPNNSGIDMENQIRRYNF